MLGQGVLQKNLFRASFLKATTLTIGIQESKAQLLYVIIPFTQQIVIISQ
jgi:hypothetical protein